MFDIGWSEILVIAVVAIIVVGPKELPKMLRAFGRTMGTVRRTANDFKRQFDEALREAERQADLGEVKATLQSVSRMDPVADLKKDLSAPLTPSPSPAKPAATAHPAEPIKSGPAEQTSSDAA